MDKTRALQSAVPVADEKIEKWGHSSRTFPMHLDIFTVCVNSQTDRFGHTSIREILHKVAIPALPNPINLELFARFRYGPGEEGEHQLELSVTDPDGMVVLQTEPASHRFGALSDDGFSCSSIACPLRWIVKSYGDYTIRLSIDGSDHFTELAIKSVPNT